MRSEFTNKLIKSFVCKEKKDVMIIEDDKQEHVCYTFKQACTVIDAAKKVKITVRSYAQGNTYGVCFLDVLIKGPDQIVMRTDNSYMDARIRQANEKK